jgi:tRNA A-37 threonylcarbamoyl transferase component Bud32
VEVLGAGMERVTLGLYRGVLITREAEGFVNLWEWLRSKPTAPQREAVAAATARVIAQLHAVGIEHPDLNLTNILVRTATDMPTVLVIDFDRARLLPGPLPPRRRTRNLHRLRRSLNKLDPEGQFCSATDLQIFCQGYHTWYSEHG